LPEQYGFSLISSARNRGLSSLQLVPDNLTRKTL
jgi:hypothetical protein